MVSVVVVVNCNVIVLDAAVTAVLAGVKIKVHVALAGGVLYMVPVLVPDERVTTNDVCVLKPVYDAIQNDALYFAPVTDIQNGCKEKQLRWVRQWIQTMTTTAVKLTGCSVGFTDASRTTARRHFVVN